MSEIIRRNGAALSLRPGNGAFGIIQSTGAVTTGKAKSGTLPGDALSAIADIRFGERFGYSLFHHSRTQKIGFPAVLFKA
ncbi:hypothetical protein RJJ65_32535 [Rhizobium hidalgonense]|uniref:Uncharacterized protein n=1 Tax=Rhizobium hidalgonense TaxID=1538159 RepID=A0AAJ2LPS3_9HYPH|nr:hypothetical protein [Rhizobium hidalgonense]MDR9777288.1 hypothetical protein [Rhizobium hidalgonense]MDR9823679.1 hypothetical protein [Rhizobium hidalgonense]RWX17443.1 hypothetical protein EHI42_10230 [Rhizobium hidalgonense]